MRQHRGGGLFAAAFAFLLVAGACLLALDSSFEDPAAVGKVASYEAGKSISVEAGKDKKEFKITADTKVEGEVAVGKEVQVWAKEHTATKIVAKK